MFRITNLSQLSNATVLKSRLKFGATFLGAVTVSSVCLSLYSKVLAATEKKKLLALSSEEFREFKLKEKKNVSHNSNIYRFALQSPEHELDLPVASFVMVQADLGEEKPVVRPYTPITYDEKGYFDLLIKSYYPNGKISKYMDSLKVGDSIKIKGPIKKFEYNANMKKNIGMIAGGSGITPMLQLLHEILKNPNDHTQVSLLYSNTTADDILLRDRIDELAKKHKNFKVYYTVSKPPEGWTQGVGHTTKDMVEKALPPPGDDTLIFVCGPPPLMKSISGEKVKEKNGSMSQGPLVGVLKERGFKESHVYKF